MAKRQVIDRKALPTRNPLLFFVVVALLLERQGISDLWWGVFYTTWFVFQCAHLNAFFSEVDVLPEGFGERAAEPEADEPRAGSQRANAMPGFQRPPRSL